MTQIPEYYATEEEVLLLLKDYIKSQYAYTKEEIDELVSTYMSAAQVADLYLNKDDAENTYRKLDSVVVSGTSYNAGNGKFITTYTDGHTTELNLGELISQAGSSIEAPITSTTVFVYTQAVDGQVPSTPVGGEYSWSQYALTTAPVDPTDTYTWQSNTNGLSISDSTAIWVSSNTFASNNDTPVGQWSIPVLYSGTINRNTKTTTESHITYDTVEQTIQVRSRVVTAYHEGTVLYHQAEEGVDAYYESIAPITPVGGVYNTTSNTLTTGPHNPNSVSDIWSVSMPQSTNTYHDIIHDADVNYTLYFSIGSVIFDNDGNNYTITWETPAVVGMDYTQIAYNMKFVAIDYTVLAQSITLQTSDLNLIADRISATAEDMQFIASHITLGAEDLEIIAQNVDIESDLTNFHGDVMATSFAVAESEEYYELKDNIVLGYYYNDGFYSDAEHTDPITGDPSYRYLDCSTKKQYTFSNNQFTESSDPVKTTTKEWANNKLFSISRNRVDDTVHDSYLDDDDVVMLIYNKGDMNVTEGDVDTGGGSGSVTDNDVSYVVSPKRLSQSMQTTFQHKVRQYECYKTQTDWNYYTIENTLIQAAIGSDNISHHKSGTFTLPDPQKYVGTTITMSVYPCTRTSENVQWSGNIDGGDEVWYAVDNMIMHGRQYSINDKFYNHALSLQSGTNDEITSTMWYALNNDPIAHDYVYDEVKEWYIPSSIYNYEVYKKLVDLFPQIKIDDNSVWQFVKVLPCDETTSYINGFDTNDIGIVSLDTDIYKNIKTLRDNMYSGTYFNIDDFKDLKWGLEKMSASLGNHSANDNIDKFIDRMTIGSTIKEDNRRSIDNASSCVCILPTYSGFQKLCNNEPLSFTAIARKLEVPCAWEDRTSATYSFLPGQFYYWEIQSLDFAPVIVTSGTWQQAYTANSVSCDATVGKISFPKYNSDYNLISDITLAQCADNTDYIYDQVIDQSKQLSCVIADVKPFVSVLVTLGYLRSTTIGDTNQEYHDNTGLWYEDKISQVALASMLNTNV